jgi:hypothetical protein
LSSAEQSAFSADRSAFSAELSAFSAELSALTLSVEPAPLYPGRHDRGETTPGKNNRGETMRHPLGVVALVAGLADPVSSD